MPVPLDEYPIHQTPLSMEFVGSSDRNFYDRCYFNAHDRTGDLFFVSGLGFYPNLGVKDAYAAVRRGDKQWVVRCSDLIDDNRMQPAVGPYRIEVVKPLEQVRIVCDADDSAIGGGIGFDLTWDGSFPAIDEESHHMRQGRRSIIDTWRFAQVGTWTGSLRVDGNEIAVTPDTWVGTRDRSWGIRPVGEAEPPGRPVHDETFGFWWLYVPLRFESFAIVVIAQENGEGHRTLNGAVRVWPDGRIDQLGWPRVEIDYRSGTRQPERARIHLAERDGTPFVLDVEVQGGKEGSGSVPLHVGCGYGGDPEWLHGSWRGAGWVESKVYDFADPAVAGRMPWGVVDHVARATVGDHVGWGLFEHGTIGRHGPSGFPDLGAVAP
ncbi:MAG: hypothetical protein QOJ03_3467 [Frankiaceae bacterium]|jgi:hypothetical protein|nr:hypothetical protein [Frankiaceae bacterium]